MKIQSIAFGIVAILIIAGGLVAVEAGNDNGEGNGLTSKGKHYTLNILGKNWNDEEYAEIAESMDPNNGYKDPEYNPILKEDNGHRIFVRLGSNGDMKKTRILLYDSATISEAKDFQVLDADGTDGKAAFALPKPNTVVEGGVVTESAYTVWIRVLGPPQGQADMYSGFYDPSDGGSTWVSLEVIDIRQSGGKVNRESPPKFVDVTKELTTIYVDMTDDDTYNPVRFGLFDNTGYQYFWDYDNQGIKHVQLRFYDYDPTV